MDSYFLSVRCSKWVCSHFSVTFQILISTGMASKSCFLFPVQVYNLFTLLTCIRLEFHYAFLLVEALHSFSGNSQIFLVFFIKQLDGRFPALSACILYICLKVFSTFSPRKFHLERKKTRIYIFFL